MLCTLLPLAAAREPCTKYWPNYFTCTADSCTAGKPTRAVCNISDMIACEGDRVVEMDVPCVYCWQLPESSVRCGFPDACRATARPQLGQCSPHAYVPCLGDRTFRVQMMCGKTAGYSFATALLLTIAGGGFGLDRFYLGYFWTGLLKMASLGGLGVWSVIDAIRLLTGTLMPSDGSRFG